MNDDLSNIRAECKKHGIKVSKKNLSWGPHLEFSVDGHAMNGVLTADFREKYLPQFQALAEIKAKYKNGQINGQKIYGLA